MSEINAELLEALEAFEKMTSVQNIQKHWHNVCVPLIAKARATAPKREDGGPDE